MFAQNNLLKPFINIQNIEEIVNSLCKHKNLIVSKLKKDELINKLLSYNVNNQPENKNIPRENKKNNESLGLTFEKAICLKKEITYNGKFKYSETDALKLKDRLNNFNELCPHELIHTAKKGYKYDYESKDGKYKLSAKTNKNGYKVCPQVIGQTTKNKFCKYFKIPDNTNDNKIKEYIMNEHKKMLGEYFTHTFDCDIIYYNQKTNILKFIKKENDINFDNFEYVFTKNIDEWIESSTIKINYNNSSYSLGEFQIHQHRNCIKFRWNFNTILTVFKENFKITDI